MQKEKTFLKFTTVNDHGKLAVTEGMSADRGQTGLNWFSLYITLVNLIVTFYIWVILNQSGSKNQFAILIVTHNFFYTVLF